MTNDPTTRETADHAELAACPFCGGDPFDCGFRRWECGLCGAKGPAGRKNDATSGWNSRAGEAALLSEIAALRGERDHNWPAVERLDLETRLAEQAGRATQAERQRDELRKALDRQCDNMSFVLNRVYLHAWADKFSREVAEDRALLANQGADQ